MIHLPGIRRPHRWPGPIPSALLLVAAKYKVRRNGWRVFGLPCPFCHELGQYFETFFGVRSFVCENEACASHADPQRQGFFTTDDLPGGIDASSD